MIVGTKQWEIVSKYMQIIARDKLISNIFYLK